MTGVRREWMSGHNFLMLHLDLIDALGGSWEAAGVLNRIAYRSGADGWWTATLTELGADCRLSERRIKRAVAELRDAGMIVSERVDPFRPTLRWRVAYDGEPAPEGRNVTDVKDETSVTVKDETSFSPSSKNLRTQPPAQASGEPPVLALVASADVAEPVLFGEPDQPPTWPPEATANGCRQAWLKGYTDSHGTPDPTIKRRAFGKIRDAAKDRGDDLEAWRRLWTACSEAGHAGRWDVSAHLAPAPAARYPQGASKNPYVALAEAAAAGGAYDHIFDRPAIGGPA